MDMHPSASCAHSVIHVLETNPGQFVSIARQTSRLPGVPTARDYSDAEIEQLNRGIVNILLEAVRNEQPKARAVFFEHAIPSFVLEGETPANMVHWNTSYLILFGSALAACVPAEHRAQVLAWFSGFSGAYVADLLQAASEAAAGLQA